MNETSFTLIPFPASSIPDVLLTGTISLENHLLRLHYSLTGEIEDIQLPPPSPRPRRRDELWKRTCFEFFLAVQEEPGYWEFNMSPSGDWNLYRMDAYRRVGFREESAISQLDFEFSKGIDDHVLHVSVDLNPLFEPNMALQAAISVILQTEDGNETYWALTHPAPRPDFHLRESFILELEEQTHPSPQSAVDG